MKSIMVLALAAMACTGCNSVSTAYVDATGKHGSGKITYGTYNMSNGEFSIADAGVTCSGSFPDWAAYTVVFPVKCTDGRSGQASMTRPSSTGMSVLAGEGTIHFIGGEIKRFVFAPSGAI